MGNSMEYKILSEASVIDFIVNELKFFKDKSNLICEEIGDGNLNHVFRIKDSITDKSIILKQALPYARTSKEMILDSERCRIEAMALIEQGKYAQEMVPVVYGYDNVLCAMAQEDLSDYVVLRAGMMQQIKYPRLAKDSAFFFANTLIRTSDIVLDSKYKKDELIRFVNKDLCELSEKLVLTSPTCNDPRNKIAENIKDFVKNELVDDTKVRKEFAILKHKFMTSAQALLHGDAHTGSIFINLDSTKFFDAEFSFYGPMGFDVGMFLGNLFMDAVYQNVNGFDDYYSWVKEIIAEFIDEFKVQFKNVWSEYANEQLSIGSKEFKKWYLEDVLKDAAGYCACEMIRRTTGSSHVKEMDDYDDEVSHEYAQRKNITMAIEILLNQGKFTKGHDYKNLLKRVLE